MIILQDEGVNPTDWDEFVENNEAARFCHLFRYADVLDCYGYAAKNICFVKKNVVVGVFPAVVVQSILFGRKMVSQPFSEYGGFLLDPKLEERDIREMFQLLRSYAEEKLGVRVIEMHGNHGVPQALRGSGMVASQPQQIAVLVLDRNIDELWDSIVAYSVRKAVNQAQRRGVTVDTECNEQAICERFFPLYLRSMKRLGVPPHKVEYYINCYRAFGERMVIFWAKAGHTDVAALLGFTCGGRVSIVNTVSDPEHWHLRPNDLLHWEFIKWSVERGLRYFDFGNIRYEGQEIFKKKWGGGFYDHRRYTVIMRKRIGTASTIESSSDAMRLMANAWARYVPYTVARRIGPCIRKHLAR